MTKLLKQIGQLFIIGFPEPKPSKAFLNFISEEDIGGVILFGANCSTHQVIQKNIQQIKDNSPNNMPFIAVDQEGGRVCRITGAPAEFASPAKYGHQLGISHYSEDFGRSALCMEKLGVNLVLGPVADIRLNEGNSCLKDRCFGSTAEEVIPFVKSAVQVCQANGLLSCLKHFPGFGAATIDPHEETSEAGYDELVWEQRERRTFAAGIDSGADMVMTTHLRLPKIDSEIVTASESIVGGLLRSNLAFDGPVITDDLSMAGAECLGSPGERAVAAFRAGHDILLFGQDTETAMVAYDYFKEALRRGEFTEDRIRASLDRVGGIKFKLGKPAVF